MEEINDDASLSTAIPVSPPHSPLTLPALFSLAIRDPVQRVMMMGGLACLALFSALFQDNFCHFYYAWTTDDNYSHGFLVPLLSLYFASQIVRRGPVEIQSGVISGGVLLGLAILGRLVTIPLPIPFLGDLRASGWPGGNVHPDPGDQGIESVLVRVFLPRIHGPITHRHVLTNCVAIAITR